MTVHALLGRPNAPNSAFSALTPQYFPADARAVIYRPAPSGIRSARAQPHEWKLRFERRTPPFVEPLMGWTGSDDTLAEVELSFPSVVSAIAYAERQGLTYTVQRTGDESSPNMRVAAHSTAAERAASARRRRLQWVEDRLGSEAILHGYGAGAIPAARYARPQDVLNDEKLNYDQKLDMLQRWALEAYLLDLAYSKGAPEIDASRLQEVIDALLKLDQLARFGKNDNARAARLDLSPNLDRCRLLNSSESVSAAARTGVLSTLQH
jgi:hypothetical protein